MPELATEQTDREKLTELLQETLARLHQTSDPDETLALSEKARDYSREFRLCVAREVAEAEAAGSNVVSEAPGAPTSEPHAVSAVSRFIYRHTTTGAEAAFTPTATGSVYIGHEGRWHPTTGTPLFEFEAALTAAADYLHDAETVAETPGASVKDLLRRWLLRQTPFFDGVFYTGFAGSARATQEALWLLLRKRPLLDSHGHTLKTVDPADGIEQVIYVQEVPPHPPVDKPRVENP